MMAMVQDDLARAAGRRRAFGDFLRSRRERLVPADVGLPPGFRRRAKGLRREEVALLAGVGATWYTWLEQGRDVHPSAEVLAALADALRLDQTERQHLFLLAGRSAPENRPAVPERVPEPLRRVLDSLTRQPAQVIGRRWDVLAWNRAAEVVFGDFGRLAGDERNLMHLLFADSDHRRLIVDWDELAPATLAMFRADSARHAGDADFERLVAKLRTKSADFDAMWRKQDVLRTLSGRKRIRHPLVGFMVFEVTNFAVVEPGALKLMVYTPVEEHETAARLDRLLAGEPATAARA
jgi:transcriptional regulator with XRE-family HTH domain